MKTALKKRAARVRVASDRCAKRISTGVAEFDEVLGGGMVPGSMTVVHGRRGGGKTTLLLRVAMAMGHRGTRVIFASGEQSKRDLVGLIHRTTATSRNVSLHAATEKDTNGCEIREVVSEAERLKPKLLIVDSAQTAFIATDKSDVGSLGQIRAVVHYLASFSKTADVAVVIIGHDNKQGELAGPAALSDLADTIVTLDPRLVHDPTTGEVIPGTEGIRRLAVDKKNRYGAADVAAYLEMTERGLVALSRAKRRLVAR